MNSWVSFVSDKAFYSWNQRSPSMNSLLTKGSKSSWTETYPTYSAHTLRYPCSRSVLCSSLWVFSKITMWTEFNILQSHGPKGKILNWGWLLKSFRHYIQRKRTYFSKDHSASRADWEAIKHRQSTTSGPCWELFLELGRCLEPTPVFPKDTP